MFFGKLFGKKSEEEDELLDSLEPSSCSCDAPPAYNIILIGSTKAHKKELLKILCDCEPVLVKSYWECQMGVNFKRKEVELTKANKIKLNIWDITGDENFGEIVPQYCRGAHGIMFYYDSKDTFKHIESVIEKDVELFYNLGIPFYLVGISGKEYGKKSIKKIVLQVKKLANKIGARTVNCNLDDEKGINEMFISFIGLITMKYVIEPSDKGSENNNGDLLPRLSSSPPLPPSSSSSLSSSQQQQQQTTASSISICKYEGPKRDVEVQRNENGLFGNYYANHDYLCYDISVLGNPRIGKSCLCARCLTGNNNSKIKEINKLWMCSFNLPNNMFMRLRMIEGALPLSGSDPRLETHYSHSHAVLLCYDITDRASFDAVRGAAAEVRDNAMRGTMVMVVGLKYDAKKQCVSVPGSEGKALADSHGMHFRECSAKDNVGVRETLAKILLELQKIDSFALPIRTDDANRMLPLSVSYGKSNGECEIPQPPSLLGQIVSGQNDKGKSNYTTFGEYDYLFKILLVSDYGVGKSSLLLRYADDVFPGSSVGVDFKIKTIRTINRKIVKLQICDSSGVERFYFIASSYYRGSHAIIMCFDTTNPESFENVKRWMDDVERYGREGTPIIIVGTKCDLPPVVDLEDAREYADSIDAPFMLCSAKTGEGVNEVFEKITECIFLKMFHADYCADLKQDE